MTITHVPARHVFNYLQSVICSTWQLQGHKLESPLRGLVIRREYRVQRTALDVEGEAVVTHHLYVWLAEGL